MTAKGPVTYALLLRGVNLGPSRKLPMADLKAVLNALGHDGVRTYLASGQAFVTTDRPPAEVAAELERHLADETGLRTEVMIRSHAELEAVVAANPFEVAAGEGARHGVVFLGQPLKKGDLAALEGKDWSPDEFAGSGSEIYLRLPNGFGVSKLLLAMARLKQGPAATTRNWNTVLKLAELTA